MYNDKKIGVVVPAYNEERFIASVINTVPDFVDKIYVVDDASTDNTYEIASNIARQKCHYEPPPCHCEELRDEAISEAGSGGRIAVITHEQNKGIGAAVVSGHKVACKDRMDIVAIMAGDGQMDPAILHKILAPVVEGKADFAKGDRLSIPQYKKAMSAWRAFGNFLLTHLTRIASGYWHISDPQDGYTAISTKTLQKLDLDRIKEGFAFENDILVKLNVIGARVVNIPHPAIYQGQHSKIRYPRFIVKTSWLLLKDFLWRLKVKYFRRDSKSC